MATFNVNSSVISHCASWAVIAALRRELRDLNAACARLFAPIRYHSLDIAITDKGPVVIEINFGGGFDLPQFATGKGLLTDEIRGFFESRGYNFGRRFGSRRSGMQNPKTR